MTYGTITALEPRNTSKPEGLDHLVVVVVLEDINYRDDSPLVLVKIISLVVVKTLRVVVRHVGGSEIYACEQVHIHSRVQIVYKPVVLDFIKATDIQFSAGSLFFGVSKHNLFSVSELVNSADTLPFKLMVSVVLVIEHNKLDECLLALTIELVG